jgi:hypothetical protein
MNKLIRLIPFLLLAVFLAVPAFSQQAPSTPWMQFEQELGLATTYSVDMSIQAMGMNMDSKIIRDGGKTRTEMVMPFFNLKTVILEIPENGRTVSYSLFPEKQKYLLNEEDDDATPAAAPKIEELGTETVDGVECTKRRIRMTEDGVSSEVTMWFSPAQKNMPVKMVAAADVPMQPGQPAMPMQSTILFKNYDFSTPAADLFDVPAGYTKISDMMEVMMDGSAGGLGALMQQMQNLQVEE